ncbi:hypothetical protein B296_00007552 [Ensete ventricosum]|uniref:DEAD/DEAH box helicase domain-containing protein n=1 Tax=Ensete ventricosum TaxID=4639 RepID=A0A426ZXK1_ENSVE|nr:hypothetical protein B296_00007552 [Ensete ventricosum]
MRATAQDLRSCEPEFLVATPERLLELVSLKAIDISGVSLLVSTFHCGTYRSARLPVCGSAATWRYRQNQSSTIDFGRRRLIEGEFDRRRSFEGEKGKKKKKRKRRKKKTSFPRAILARALDEVPIPDKILLVSKTANKFQMLRSSLKEEGYEISEDSSCAFSIISDR